ncbi:MAG: DUF3459 domain-containing protein [Alphaproteobacteria bacterium]|jgi:alpha-glucosidase|nr:DUF3459 domain-containing protein [Alphaproteobacteria bacterium]
MREWWRGAVIYQIYPRSFCDGNDDGLGDLPGITAKLGYVRDLGVDGIWLSPIFTSPMKDGGYDVADYCDIDPIFGTLADFDRLVERAHELGLKVIIDQVYSHSSDLNPWFRESRQSRDNPKADWYVWSLPQADGTPPNNWLSVFGGPAWSWDPRRRQYYMHNFLPEQPELNFHNDDVQRAILDVARFWLDRGVDGFRLDVANFFMHDPLLRDNPPSGQTDTVKPYRMQRPLHNRSRPETFQFVARLRHCLDEYPERMAVAEIASETPLKDMVDYTDGPERYHTAYTFEFLRDTFSAAHIRTAVSQASRGSPDAWPSWAFSNHDVMRVLTRWGGFEATPWFAKLLIAVLVSLRGTAFLYQGEELGLPQARVPYDRLRDPEGITFWPDYESRDNARTPMPWTAGIAHAGFSTVEPWLPVDPVHIDRAVDRQEADEASPLNFTKRFLAWRKQHPALIGGDIRFFETAEPVLAFERLGEGGRLLCAFNLARTPARADLGFDGTATRLPAPDLPGTVKGRTVTLPGYGAVFARLD